MSAVSITLTVDELTTMADIVTKHENMLNPGLRQAVAKAEVIVACARADIDFTVQVLSA